MPYDTIIGSVLIGSWLNSFLVMLEGIQAWRFYTRKQAKSSGAQSALIKFVVGMVLMVDAVSTIGAYACVYMYGVAHWGDQQYLLVQYWPLSVYVLTSGVNGFIVQLYLVWRFWLMAKQRVICLFLCISGLGALVGSVMTVVYLAKYPNYVDRHYYVPAVTTWLVATTVTDLGIATGLVFQLRTYKTQFKRTQSLIKRLIYSAIHTGTFTSLLAVIVLIAYLLDEESNITVGFGFCLGRAYGCTLLYNLNAKRMGEGDDTTEKSANQYSNSNGVSQRFGGNINQLETLGGIHVHQTAFVHMDDASVKPQRSSRPVKAEGLDTDDDAESMKKDILPNNVV